MALELTSGQSSASYNIKINTIQINRKFNLCSVWNGPIVSLCETGPCQSQPIWRSQFVIKKLGCDGPCWTSGLSQPCWRLQVVIANLSAFKPGQRRYFDLPRMHCFQWDILYRWLCGLSLTKPTYIAWLWRLLIIKGVFHL